MKRLILAFAVLAGCETPEEAAQREAIEATIAQACADGNLQACIAIQQREDRQRQARAAALSQIGRDLQRQSQVTTTNCYSGYNSLSCTTY